MPIAHDSNPLHATPHPLWHMRPSPWHAAVISTHLLSTGENSVVKPEESKANNWLARSLVGAPFSWSEGHVFKGRPSTMLASCEFRNITLFK